MADSYSFLQRLWSDSIQNVTLNDIKIVIKETQEMDDEHGAFWVGCDLNGKDYVLETHKDLEVIFDIDDTEEIRGRASSWSDIENIYKTYLEGDIEMVRSIVLTMKKDL